MCATTSSVSSSVHNRLLLLLHHAHAGHHSDVCNNIFCVKQCPQLSTAAATCSCRTPVMCTGTDFVKRMMHLKCAASQRLWTMFCQGGGSPDFFLFLSASPLVGLRQCCNWYPHFCLHICAYASPLTHVEQSLSFNTLVLFLQSSDRAAFLMQPVSLHFLLLCPVCLCVCVFVCVCVCVCVCYSHLLLPSPCSPTKQARLPYWWCFQRLCFSSSRQIPGLFIIHLVHHTLGYSSWWVSSRPVAELAFFYRWCLWAKLHFYLQYCTSKYATVATLIMNSLLEQSLPSKFSYWCSDVELPFLSHHTLGGL